MSVKLYNYQTEIETKWWTFPGGERNVRVIGAVPQDCTIRCDFRSSNDLVDLLLLNNAIRYQRPKATTKLVIFYFPFARQDRVMTNGEPLALQVAANLINSCGFSSVETWDAHSDVLAGMFQPGVLEIVPQHKLHYSLLKDYKNCALISPDAGASKKVYKTAKMLYCPVIEASKKRDVNTGEITATSIDTAEFGMYNALIVVDDICDGGKTFLELGKVIRESFKGELVLCVTHGIFSKGIEVFDGLYDKVLFVNDMRAK